MKKEKPVDHLSLNLLAYPMEAKITHKTCYIERLIFRSIKSTEWLRKKIVSHVNSHKYKRKITIIYFKRRKNTKRNCDDTIVMKIDLREHKIPPEIYHYCVFFFLVSFS